MLSRYWRVDGLSGVELLRADASTHRYARHSHEGYALGVVQLLRRANTATPQADEWVCRALTACGNVEGRPALLPGQRCRVAVADLVLLPGGKGLV